MSKPNDATEASLSGRESGEYRRKASRLRYEKALKLFQQHHERLGKPTKEQYPVFLHNLEAQKNTARDEDFQLCREMS